MFLDSDGYLRVKSRGKWRKEHRVVMEHMLGRKLEKDEHVHHIDGYKTNNNPSNLTLVSLPEHNAIHKTGNNYWAGRKHRPDSKSKMSDFARTRTGNKNPNYRRIPLGQAILFLKHDFTLKEIAPIWNIDRQSLSRKLRHETGIDISKWTRKHTQRSREKLSAIAKQRYARV